MSGQHPVDVELAASRQEVANLRRELDETNRGLIALYAELESAREAEARLAAIVQSSDDAMCSATTEQIIDTWNAGAERLLGYPAVEAVGQPVDLIVPEERRGELDAMMERLRSGGRAVSFDTWRRRRDGSLIEVAVTVSPMRGPGDRLIGYAAVLRDLTDRRRAEATLAATQAAREVLATRDQIARDLREGAVQAIFAVGMRLQAAATTTDDPALSTRLGDIVQQLDAVIANLRRDVFAIREEPPA